MAVTSWCLWELCTPWNTEPILTIYAKLCPNRGQIWCRSVFCMFLALTVLFGMCLIALGLAYVFCSRPCEQNLGTILPKSAVNLCLAWFLLKTDLVSIILASFGCAICPSWDIVAVLLCCGTYIVQLLCPGTCGIAVLAWQLCFLLALNTDNVIWTSASA